MKTTNKSKIMYFSFFTFIMYCICTVLLLFFSSIGAFIAMSIFFVSLLISEIYISIELNKVAAQKKNDSGMYTNVMIENLCKKIIDRNNRIENLEQEIRELKNLNAKD